MKKSAWNRAQYTQNGIPLIQGERIIQRFPGVSLTIPRLRFGSVGTVVVTDQRIVFPVANRPLAVELPVARILSMNSTVYPGATQYAFYSFTLDNGENFSFQGLVNVIVSLSTTLSSLKVTSTTAPSSTGGTVVKKKIIKPPPKSATIGYPTVPGVATAAAGIAGIQDGVKQEISQRDQALSAVHDIEDLKSSATSLKNIARDLSTRTDSACGSEVNKIILALGLNDMDNAATDGAHVDAARSTAQQFATTMEKLLPSFGGILSVAEAYVFFNRALGSKLISPTDMKYVLKEIESSPGKYKIRTEEIAGSNKTAHGSKKNDKIKIVLLESVSFEAIKAEILKHCQENQYATPLAISKRTKLPTTIAKQYLLRAETEGVLSRDDSMAGLRFYPNTFSTFKLIDL